MLFQELIEHHVVDRHVSQAFNLPFPVADSQLGIYFGNILGDQAIIEIVWRRALVFWGPSLNGRRPVLVCRQFARIAHGLNVLLVASRRNVVTKFTVAKSDRNEFTMPATRPCVNTPDLEYRPCC